jgi:predicted RNase H-like HicB family nuclease
LDIASQGTSIEETRENLLEALKLFFEVADPSEIMARMHSDQNSAKRRKRERGE